MKLIDQPLFGTARPLDQHWTLLPAWLPVPGAGNLAVNSFLLKGDEPLLVDTGLACLQSDFMSALEAEIDLEDLRWIWLSHLDADHVGNLEAVLRKAPQAKVLTTFLGAGKLGLQGFDQTRIQLLEAGKAFIVGDHCFYAVRPPYYDAPETCGFYEERSRSLFVVDAFGAILSDLYQQFGDIHPDELFQGLGVWAEVDAPWLRTMNKWQLASALKSIESLAPRNLLTAHLPIANQEYRQLLTSFAKQQIAMSQQADPWSLQNVGQVAYLRETA